MKKTVLYLLLLSVLTIPIVLPFFGKGYFSTHDGGWAVVRLGAMQRAFIDHHFPVRWAGNQNFGYGYPLFLFTYPLPYYIGTIFAKAGLGLVGSIKILFVLSVLLSACSMFFLAKEFFSEDGAFLASAFYIYAPYRLVNLYVRGSIGESLSLVLFPLLLLGAYKIYQSYNPRYISLLALLIGSLFTIHNISALLFMPFLVAFFLILVLRSSKQKRKLLSVYFITSLVLGILLSSFFLIPALLDKNTILVNQTKLADLSQNFVSLAKLLIPSWGYGPYPSANGFSVQLGIVHVVAIILALIMYLKTKKDSFSFIFLFSFLSFSALILLSLPVSLLFWQKIPLFSNVDFPWRVLNPIVFFLSLGVGRLGFKRSSFLGGVGLVIIGVVLYFPYIRPMDKVDLPDGYYFTNDATTTSADELMPVWVLQKPTKRFSEKVEVSKEVKIDGLAYNSVKTSFTVVSQKLGKIVLNTIYFPGWNVFVDNKNISTFHNNASGLIEFEIPEGKHTVLAEFKETTSRLFADSLSVIGIIAIVLIFFQKKLFV